MTFSRLEPDWPNTVIPWLSASLNREGIDANRFVRQVLMDPNYDPDGLIVAEVDGEPVGVVWATHRRVPLENAPNDSHRGYLNLLAVRPEHRRCGVGRELVRRAEQYLAAQGTRTVMVSGYAPGYFMAGVDAAYPGAVEFFLANGYQEVYRPIAMQADLWDTAEPDWVQGKRDQLRTEGVVVEPFRPELAWPLLQFARDHFAGDWVRWVREAVVAITQGDDPARLVVAWQDPVEPKVLGFSHYLAERYGPVGVRESERGRGIGQVLLYDTLRAQRAKGLRSSWFLWSDDRTAERLYSAAGFREVRRFVYMKKEL